MNESKDMINHPPHYTFGEKYEVIDVIDNWGISFGFCIGSAIKYVARAKHKGNRLEDLKKARWYINHLIIYINENKYCSSSAGLIKINTYNKTISDYDVIQDWELDEYEGRAISHLGEAAKFGFWYCWKETTDYLCLAKNQVDGAIEELKS